LRILLRSDSLNPNAMFGTPRGMMKILQYSHVDLMGNRFNGFELNKYFRAKGHDASQCVWLKQSDSDKVWQLFDVRKREEIRFALESVERKLSIQSLLYPFPLQFPFDRRFRTADIVHYHIIHCNNFSLALLPLLTWMKPSVWTLHDPWAMTGHCVYPYDCERWEIGCGSCPYLGTQFPMKEDRTHLMWTIKKYLYCALKVDIVVASRFMLEMVSKSPLFTKFRVHHIPFGIDLNLFRPADQAAAKNRLEIIPGSLVISFRSTNNEFKGLPYIKECLRRLKFDKPICLLTFNEVGLLEEFKDKYQVIDLGWVNDPEVIINAYNAADLFLMPSTQESFGLMAMESMACGKPIIVFDGTSLPEVVFAPEGGISVPQGDVDALLFELQQLLDSPERRLQIGNRALELAKLHYDFNDHAEKMLQLYEDVIARRRAESF